MFCKTYLQKESITQGWTCKRKKYLNEEAFIHWKDYAQRHKLGKGWNPISDFSFRATWPLGAVPRKHPLLQWNQRKTLRKENVDTKRRDTKLCWMGGFHKTWFFEILRFQNFVFPQIRKLTIFSLTNPLLISPTSAIPSTLCRFLYQHFSRETVRGHSSCW